AGEAARRLAVGDEGYDLGLPFEDAVTDEVCRDVALGHHLGGGLGIREALRAATARPLRFHRLLEALPIDAQPFGGQDVLGEVEREAVGVVEAERRLAREGPRAGLARPRDLLREEREPPVERRGEALFLTAHDVGDLPLLRD